MWNYKEVSPGLFKIEDEKINQLIIKKINKFWNTDNIFPAAQPVSIERRNFEQLKKENYVVCAKLDGERYLLLLTELPDNEENTLQFNILVNRRLECFIITQTFSKDSYTKGCLFDGELVDNQFVIHDTICILGESIKEKTWDYRWKKCNKFLQYHYFFTPNSFRISLKEFFFFRTLENLFQKIEKDKIKSDGIVFYPMNDPIGTRTQPNLFKWKPPGHHTIDFKIKVNNEYVFLITWGKSQEIEFDKVPINKFKDFYPEDNQVVEFIGIKGNFKPLRLRIDKPFGNNLYTVRKTLLNIKENITKNDLIQLSKEV